MEEEKIDTGRHTAVSAIAPPLLKPIYSHLGHFMFITPPHNP